MGIHYRLYSLYHGRGRYTTRSDEQLVKEADAKQEYQAYVAIAFDEMKIKGLVYDKNEFRSIIGFIDLGPVNNAFASFDCTLDESGGHTAPIAKQILVFMVRGIFMEKQPKR